MNSIKLKKEIIFFLFFISSYSFSQKNTSATSASVTRITILNPGLSYEKSVSKLNTLLLRGFLSTTFSVGYSSTFGNYSNITFDPASTVEYRHYYNLNERVKNKKLVSNNNLNYIGSIGMVIFSKNRMLSSHFIEENRRAINTLGVVWGIQRNYKKRFSLDFSAGAGYTFTKATYQNMLGEIIHANYSKFAPLVRFNFGLWLNKRK